MVQRRPIVDEFGMLAEISGGDTVDVLAGGTGLNSFTAGDIIYADALNSLAALPIGTDDQVLTVNAGVISWEDAEGGGGADLYFMSTEDKTVSNEFAVTSIVPVGIGSLVFPSDFLNQSRTIRISALIDVTLNVGGTFLVGFRYDGGRSVQVTFDPGMSGNQMVQVDVVWKNQSINATQSNWRISGSARRFDRQGDGGILVEHLSLNTRDAEESIGRVITTDFVVKFSVQASGNNATCVHYDMSVE